LVLIIPQVPISVVWICTFRPYPIDRIHDRDAYVKPKRPKLVRILGKLSPLGMHGLDLFFFGTKWPHKSPL
jgi:hypothetical protein